MLGARDVALVNKACDMLLDELVGKYKTGGFPLWCLSLERKNATYD